MCRLDFLLKERKIIIDYSAVDWGRSRLWLAAGFAFVSFVVCWRHPELGMALATFALVVVTGHYAALAAEDLKLKDRPFLVPEEKEGDIKVLQDAISRDIRDAAITVFNAGSAAALDVWYHSRFLNAPHNQSTTMGPRALKAKGSSIGFQRLFISKEAQPEPGDWRLLVLIGFSSPTGSCYAVPCHLASKDGDWLIDAIRELAPLRDLRELPCELKKLGDQIQSEGREGGRPGPGREFLGPAKT